MKAADIMTHGAATIRPDASIAQAAQLMLQYRISGLPVLDAADNLVGIVTEGDLLRRVETGTERKRSRWLEFLVGPGRLAEEYVQTRSRRVEDVMSPSVATVSPETPLSDVVAEMERRGIKRLPVVREGKVVGIISRANLLRALARLADEVPELVASDNEVRERILSELDRQPWGGARRWMSRCGAASSSFGARSSMGVCATPCSLPARMFRVSRALRIILSSSSRFPD